MNYIISKFHNTFSSLTLACRIFESERGMIDDDIIDKEFAEWFKKYVSVVLSFLKNLQMGCYNCTLYILTSTTF